MKLRATRQEGPIRYAIPLVLCAFAVMPSATQAQQRAPKVKEEKPGLAAQATISPDSAAKRALAVIPGGAIVSAEIEEEHGALVYSYDIQRPGKSSIEEILIDAKTGAVIAHEHETPVVERAEKEAEAKAKRTTPAAKP